jgi:NADH-quinone oxidoreductase subunit G
MAGSFTNLEGVRQKFDAAIPPIGESKAGWKVLTALARTMALDSFEYEHSGDVLNEIEKIDINMPIDNQLPKKICDLPHPIMWIHYVNPLRVDDVLRHATALQNSIEHESDCVKFNSEMAKSFKITKNQGNIQLMHAKTNIEASFLIDDQVADDTLIIPDKYAIYFPKHCQIKLRLLNV